MSFMTGGYKRDKKDGRITIQIKLTEDESFFVDKLSKDRKQDPHKVCHFLLNETLDALARIDLEEAKALQQGRAQDASHPTSTLGDKAKKLLQDALG